MTRVITAIPNGDTAFHAWSLETGEEAVVVTQLVRRVYGVPCGAATNRGVCRNLKPLSGGPCWMHGEAS